MNLSFQINYRAEYGQSLCVIETKASILGWTEEHPLVMNCHGQDFWTVSLPISDFAGEVQYKYAIRLQNGGFIYEAGEPRKLVLNTNDKKLVVRDQWQVDDYEKAFMTTAFKEALFRRDKGLRTQDERLNSGDAKDSKTNGAAWRPHLHDGVASGNVRFSIVVPQVLPTQGVAIVGNIPELGNWNTDDKVAMCDCEFPLWQVAIQAEADQVIEYKYVVYDLHSGKVVDMEWGENRVVWGLQENMVICQNDRTFRRTQPRFKG